MHFTFCFAFSSSLKFSNLVIETNTDVHLRETV